jgi:hypothetical protein
LRDPETGETEVWLLVDESLIPLLSRLANLERVPRIKLLHMALEKWRTDRDERIRSSKSPGKTGPCRIWFADNE